MEISIHIHIVLYLIVVALIPSKHIGFGKKKIFFFFKYVISDNLNNKAASLCNLDNQRRFQNLIFQNDLIFLRNYFCYNTLYL